MTARGGAAAPVFKCKTDIDKIVITTNFEKRGWTRTSEVDEWNFYWAGKHTIRNIYGPDSSRRLSDCQIISHFPNHYELTRKDNLIKNLKRYHKELQREGKLESVGDVLDFVPVTYNLPADYTLFVDEFKRNPHTTWIVKPGAKCQGIGIFLINKVSQIKKWASSKQWPSFSFASGHDSYVVSRYVDNPLLIGQRKFDLRIYVLVISYRPLKAFIYRDGFARFCTMAYSNDVAQMENMFVHLTNVAVQKHGRNYNERHGGKWCLANLKLFIESTRGRVAAERLFSDIQFVILQSLKAVQSIIINDRHCFECYGYDLLIDDTLHPWLLEVNGSPSLSSTTVSDRILKTQLISEVLDIVVAPEFVEHCVRVQRGEHHLHGAMTTGEDGVEEPYTTPVDPYRRPTSLGRFEILVDETAEDPMSAGAGIFAASGTSGPLGAAAGASAASGLGGPAGRNKGKVGWR